MRTLLFLIAFCLPWTVAAQDQTGAVALVKQMMARCESVQTLQCRYHKEERIEGELIKETMDVSLRRTPFRLYLQFVEPDADRSVCFPHPQDPEKARVLMRVLGVPLSLSLAPDDKRMRKNQHHTIRRIGFDYAFSILRFLIDHSSDSLIWQVAPSTFDGHACYQVTIQNPRFRYLPYTGRPGETLQRLADTRMLSEFLLLERNPQAKSYTHSIAALPLSLPSAYAQTLVLQIDKARFFPLSLEIYDDRGLFEKYQYRQLVLNPPNLLTAPCP
ncbi:Protein of unknown function [Catalinimonas alkaloidigena]|uniref:Outer membrane lipoprotein-sorting protein n=1 Tax=Catalinimonas alkaloidigena TaxID=1075417 RepID=A0A1G8WXT3_9BACT|nr:DUF1571 domain-containing protein [Catalinimonas alkaloidigena]SDJ83024.1 Protein of unknown function [Catalinimonas alkaloidigena]